MKEKEEERRRRKGVEGGRWKRAKEEKTKEHA